MKTYKNKSVNDEGKNIKKSNEELNKTKGIEFSDETSSKVQGGYIGEHPVTKLWNEYNYNIKP